MTKTRTARKLTAGIIAIIVLSICLCITTFALIYANVQLEKNTFGTGEIKINLNDGNPVITTEDAKKFIFEPGMTVNKEFFVENKSSFAVYYRLYLENVSGGLADVLEITIKEDGRGKTLWSGKASELTKQNVPAADEALVAGARKNLIASFYYPADEGNRGQGTELEFNLCAEATQAKNNPNKEFN